MQNFICAIVVTFNPEIELLKNQYNSVISQVDHIVYIDNNSNDIASLTLLFLNKFSAENNKATVIYNNKNEGLGYAQNQGIKVAKKIGATHILLLDHDSVLDSFFLDNLLKAENELLVRNIKVAAIGPTYINKKSGEIYPITKYVGPFIKRISPDSLRFPVEASFIIASGSLIRISVLDVLGLMNEELFVDYIDVEWSFRAKNMGYGVYVSPKAPMNHQIGDNRISVFGRMISVHSPTRRYYLARNSIYMLRSPYVSWGYKLREFVFNVFRILIFSLISNDRVKYLKFSIRGLADGIKGRFGPL